MKLRNAFRAPLFWVGFVAAAVYGALAVLFAIGNLEHAILLRVIATGFLGFVAYTGVDMAWLEWKRAEGIDTN